MFKKQSPLSSHSASVEIPLVHGGPSAFLLPFKGRKKVEKKEEGKGSEMEAKRDGRGIEGRRERGVFGSVGRGTKGGGEGRTYQVHLAICLAMLAICGEKRSFLHLKRDKFGHAEKKQYLWRVNSNSNNAKQLHFCVRPIEGRYLESSEGRCQVRSQSQPATAGG